MTVYSLDIYPFPNFKPVHCSMSGSNCCFLTHIQVSQETGKVVWYSQLLKNFPVCCDHTVKGFSVVNEAEVDVFLEFLAFSVIQLMLAIWSLVPLPYLNPAHTFGSSLFTHCWSIGFWAWLIACEMSATYGSLNIVWHCPSLGLEWKLTFSSPVATAEFSKFAGILSVLSQHHLLGF